MSFATPIWLVLMPLALAAVLLGYLFARKARARALERFAAAQLLGGLLSEHSLGRERFKLVLYLLAVAALFVALARPQIGYEWQEVRARGVDLVIGMDVSQSMLARDVKPDRLERAKLAVMDLVSSLKGDRVGLVAFAGDAFLQCPLTLDYDAFRQSLEVIDTSVITTQGTNLGAAIAEGMTAFDSGNNEKIIVLVTDGEDNEGKGLAQAKKAAKKDITIYTVGVGTPEGDLIPIRDARGQEDFLKDVATGKIVKTRLDDSTLKTLAQSADGFYTPLGATGEGLMRVYEDGWSKLPQNELSSSQQRKPIERFQWPLAFAIFLLLWEPLIGTRKRHFLRLLRPRGGSLAALCLACVFLAAELRGDDALQAYEQGQYEQAEQAWAQAVEQKPDAGAPVFNRAAAFYKLGDYEQAQKLFTQALSLQAPERQKDSFFNIGNSRFMQGLPLAQSDAKAALALWENALKDYDNALEIDPQDKDAAHNRALVEKYIEELKKQEEQKQQQQDQQQQNDSQQNENKDQSKDEQSSQQNEQEQKQDQQQQEQEQQSSQDQEEQQNKEDQQQKDDSSSPEEQSSEQQQQSQQEQQQQQPEETRQPDRSGVPEEAPQPQEQQEQAAAAQAAEQAQEQPQGEPEQLGVMSRQDAGFLLDSMKNQEKKLPAAPISSGGHDDEDVFRKPVKNW